MRGSSIWVAFNVDRPGLRGGRIEEHGKCVVLGCLRCSHLCVRNLKRGMNCQITRFFFWQGLRSPPFLLYNTTENDAAARSYVAIFDAGLVEIEVLSERSVRVGEQ